LFAPFGEPSKPRNRNRTDDEDDDHGKDGVQRCRVSEVVADAPPRDASAANRGVSMSEHYIRVCAASGGM